MEITKMENNTDIDLYRIPHKILECLHKNNVISQKIKLVNSKSLVVISIYKNEMTEKYITKLLKSLEITITKLNNEDVYDDYSYSVFRTDDFLIFSACLL